MVRKNPTMLIERNLINMLKKSGHQKEFISDKKLWSFRLSDSILPKAYTLPQKYTRRAFLL